MLEIVPAGHDATSPRPGDLIFCHRNGIVSRLIRLGERVRFGDARWSHVAVVDEYIDEPWVIEALSKGVARNPLSEYHDIEYAIARTQLEGPDQEQAVRFARSCVGQKYGWWSIIGVIVRYLTPGRAGFGIGSGGSTKICSALAAQSQVRGWAIYDWDPNTITPSELASYYEQPQRPQA